MRPKYTLRTVLDVRWTAVACALWGSACRPAPPEDGAVVFLAEHVAEAEKSASAAALSQLRSVRWTLENETRLAIVAPLVSRISYSVSIPEQPVLRFATALHPIGDEESASWTRPRSVDFRVQVESGGGARETVFETPVRRHQAGRWLDHSVDLGPWAGKTVRLTLETDLPDPFLRDPGHLRAAREQYLALWGNPVLDARSARAEGTNVILISLDCVRADHVGAYGYPEARTPNIDAFAREAVVFEAAITTAPSTLPSHTSIFTGLTPLLHRANKWRRRDPAAPYLPEVLSRLEFEVNGVVTGPYLSQSFGFQDGFHSYNFLFDPRAGEAVDAALDVLDRASGRRQFLFLHLFDAHSPYLPPREFLPRAEESPLDISSLMGRIMKGRGVPTEADRRALIRLYDAEIAYVDTQVGRFLDELRARGLFDRSLIILTADHGESFGEHGNWQHSRNLYEELIHVPLIVKWPFESEARVVQAPVSHIDLFPTILEQAASDEDADALGTSLRRIASSGNHGRRKMISEFEWLLPGNTTMKIAFRGDDLKYIVTLESAPDVEMSLENLKLEELYSLAEDPGELMSLLESRVSERDGFRELLENYLKTVYGSRKAGGRIELDEATRKQLESLGYIYN